MSIYKGDNVVATLNLHSANQSLNNLNPEGQGILDGKADSDLLNLSSAGTSRLLYSPFSINNGTRDENGANVTLHTFNSEDSSEDSQVNFEQNPDGKLFEENGDFNNPDPMAFKCTPPPAVANNRAKLYQAFNYYDAKTSKILGFSTPAKRNVEIYIALKSSSNINDDWGINPTSIDIMTYNATYSPTDIIVQCAKTMTGSEPDWIDETTEVNNIKITANKQILSVNMFEIPTGYYYYLKITLKPRAKSLLLYTITLNGYRKSNSTPASLLVCDPCTVTTCDGRCYTDENSFTLNVGRLNGNYMVMKNIVSKAISMIPSSNFHIARNSSSFIPTVPWTQPKLGNAEGQGIEGNGIWNTSSFSVCADCAPVKKYNLFQAFNNKPLPPNPIENKNFLYFSKRGVQYFNLYTCSLDPLKVNYVRFIFPNQSYPAKSITVYGSNNPNLETPADPAYSETLTYFHEESNWKKLGYVYTLNSKNSQVTLNINSTEFFKYLRFSLESRPTYAQIYYIEIGAEKIGDVQLQNDYWLNISQIPAQLTICNDNSFEVNNDFVLIGECTVDNGRITSSSNIKNSRFNNGWNWNFEFPHIGIIKKSPDNASAWYRVYADGWCEQGGFVTVTPETKRITFSPTFVNDNPYISVTPIISEETSAAPTIKMHHLSNSGVSLVLTNTNSIVWTALGRVDIDSLDDY